MHPSHTQGLGGFVEPDDETSIWMGRRQTNESARGMLHHGQYSLDGFVKFIDYFMMQRGLVGGMIESKVTAVLKALDSACVRLDN